MRLVLSERRVLSSKQAQAEFQVSAMTVRRDFATLVRSGHARKTRGGVVVVDRYFAERPQTQRLTLEPEAKRMVGTLAANLVEDGDTVFVAGGTTCLALARELGARQDLTVITYSVPVLVCLMASPGIEVFASGGLASAKGDDMTGPLAEAGLRRFRARRAFVGASGITPEGVFNSSVPRGSVDAVMIQQAAEAYVLADHTKIGCVSLARVVELEKVNFVVTDKPVAEMDNTWLAKANVQVLSPTDAHDDGAKRTSRRAADTPRASRSPRASPGVS
jgi:DeoR family transcriptional regulator, fructose operon transcriptional repressor